MTQSKETRIPDEFGTESSSEPDRERTQIDYLVVGGGQAGLAVAYYLKQYGLDYLVAEAHPQIGDQWRHRWEGLSLFTPARYSTLPGSRLPLLSYTLPTRIDVADYLDAYALEHELNVRLNSRVIHLGRAELGARSRFVAQLADGTQLLAQRVIVAAGAYRTPKLPSFVEKFPSNLPYVHSSELRRTASWLSPDVQQHVLVVGAGASGHQLALLLAQQHRVTLAGKDPGYLPRLVLGLDVYDYLYGLGVLTWSNNSLIGRTLIERSTSGGEVRVGECVEESAKRNGIARTGRIDDYDPQTGDFVLGQGERVRDVTAVVLATGYDNRYEFIDLPGALDQAGRALHKRGYSPVEGLYYLGLHQMRRVGSSLIGTVGFDARELVAELAAQPIHL